MLIHHTVQYMVIGLELLIDFYVTISGQDFSYKFTQQRAGYQLVFLILEPQNNVVNGIGLHSG
jgi:hypothetical protein